MLHSQKKSPVASTTDLVPQMTRQGIEVDVCSASDGVWFDQGEIFFFARNRKKLSEKLRDAARRSELSTRPSPRTGKPMKEFELEGVGKVWMCEHTGGLWFDKPVLEKLAAAPDGIQIDLISEPEAERQPTMSGEVGLRHLPNLASRSLATLAGLYAILGLVLITAVEFFGLQLEVMLMIAIGVSLVHFAIAPWLMDLSLNWLYRIDWVDPSHLPDHLSRFVADLAVAQGIKTPRFGVLDDGAPQAFTYGHTPSNARIVISRGLFELLEPEEVEAVVAHEVGHAVHWDMFLMTVAQLVPMLLYYIYRALLRSTEQGTSSSSEKKGDIRPLLMVVAYVLYIVSQYVVLWFSRTRELHADRFAGEVTGRPRSLSSALVKIAYGLAGQGRPARSGERSSERSPQLEAVQAMGIFDAGTARNLVMAANSGAVPGTGSFDSRTLKSAMRWDMWNPWAKWYELHSTHPLTARRLDYLANQSETMGQQPLVRFDLTKPESYWDEFFVDFFIQQFPIIAGFGAISATVGPALLQGTQEASTSVDSNQLFGTLGLAVGVALLLRFLVVYAARGFEDMSVAALLKKVKVSAVRPVPCTLEGTIIGRGVPGLIYSEDFVLQDKTGIMFLDIRQPLRIWEFFFGLLRAGKYEGRAVTVEGWYRRAPVPFVEVKRLICDGETTRSWVPILNKIMAIVIAAAGAFVLLARPFQEGMTISFPFGG